MVACRVCRWSLVVASLAGMLSLGVPAEGKSASVLPPTAKVNGLSTREWAARWWQWVYAIPKSVNPLYDTTGASAAIGQSGNVWFLAGTSDGNPAVRNVTIPLGKHLFFPVLNVNNNRICLGETPEDPEALRQQLRDIVAFEDMAVEVDGRAVQNIKRFFEESVVFSVTVPEDHIFCESSGMAGPGTYGPIVDTGYYLMLAPLSKGTHVIHIQGTIVFFPGAGDFRLPVDVTYNITTVPPGQYRKR